MLASALPLPTEIPPEQESFPSGLKRLPASAKLNIELARLVRRYLVLDRDMRTIALPILRV
jgi:hypothetical protein